MHRPPAGDRGAVVDRHPDIERPASQKACGVARRHLHRRRDGRARAEALGRPERHVAEAARAAEGVFAVQSDDRTAVGGEVSGRIGPPQHVTMPPVDDLVEKAAAPREDGHLDPGITLLVERPPAGEGEAIDLGVFVEGPEPPQIVGDRQIGAPFALRSHGPLGERHPKKHERNRPVISRLDRRPEILAAGGQGKAKEKDGTESHRRHSIASGRRAPTPSRCAKIPVNEAHTEGGFQGRLFVRPGRGRAWISCMN